MEEGAREGGNSGTMPESSPAFGNGSSIRSSSGPSEVTWQPMSCACV